MQSVTFKHGIKFNIRMPEGTKHGAVCERQTTDPTGLNRLRQSTNDIHILIAKRVLQLWQMNRMPPFLLLTKVSQEHLLAEKELIVP